MKRVGIFIDGGYFDEVSKYYRYNHERSSWLSVAGMIEFIQDVIRSVEGAKEKVVVSEAHYFRGKFSADSTEAAGKLKDERVFEEVLVKVGVTPHYTQIDENRQVPKEKAVDVGLALEALDLAVQNKVDYVVLVAGDGDYVPLMKKLHGRGIVTMILAWNFRYTYSGGYGGTVERVTATSRVLAAETMYTIKMDEVVDNRDRYPVVNKIFSHWEGTL